MFEKIIIGILSWKKGLLLKNIKQFKNKISLKFHFFTNVPNKNLKKIIHCNYVYIHYNIIRKKKPCVLTDRYKINEIYFNIYTIKKPVNKNTYYHHSFLDCRCKFCFCFQCNWYIIFHHATTIHFIVKENTNLTNIILNDFKSQNKYCQINK